MSLSRRRLIATGTVAATIGATVIAGGPAFGADASGEQTQLIRVTAAGTDPSTQWIEQAYDCSDENGPFTQPNQAFVTGPGTPTLGAGSHVMTTGQYSSQTELFRTAQFDGTHLSAIQHISYATFAASRMAGDTTVKQPAYLRLSINTSGDATGGPDQSLFYEPAIDQPNDPDHAAVTDGTWQNWDATGDVWTVGGSGDPDTLKTLQQFVNEYPNAVISNPANGGGVAFIAGCSGSNQTNGEFGVDRFAITTDSVSDLFDFDPAVTPDVNTVRVTGTQGGWNAAAYNAVDDLATPTPEQGMAFGPGTPPSGIGSHVFHYGNDTNVIELWRSPVLDGVNVGDIRHLDYSTYQSPGANSPGSQQPPYLRLSVSSNGDGVYDTVLYFEPAFQHSDEIRDNAWLRWNTADALWSTDGSPDSLTTLAAFSAAHPKATVFTPEGAAGNGGLSVIVGCQCDTQRNTDFYVDDLRVDYFHGAQPDTDDTFDFEPVVPAPSISVPSMVVGRTTVAVTGHAVANSPVALYQETYPATTFTKVATTTAGVDGSYSFHRTVSKRTAFYVRDYDRTNSVTKTVRVREAVVLSLDTVTGKVLMAAHVDPVHSGLTVRFYRVRSDGTHTLVARALTGPHGWAHAKISWPSRHRITLYATASAPAGELPGQSARQSIRVA